MKKEKSKLQVLARAALTVAKLQQTRAGGPINEIVGWVNPAILESKNSYLFTKISNHEKTKDKFNQVGRGKINCFAPSANQGWRLGKQKMIFYG